MRFIYLILFLTLSLNSKIITSKQLFNKKLTKVQLVNISDKKIFYGTTTVNEKNIKDVVLRFSGYIKNLKANSTHKYVKKGDTLFSIYSKEVVIALDELTLAVKQKYNKSFIKNIEQRLELLEVPKSVIKNIKKTKKTPYYINIKSKHNGIIINKIINGSSFIKSGQTVFQLMDLRDIWVNAQVYQKDLSFISKNMNANIFIDGLGTFKSKVTLIHPNVNNKTKTISVRLVLKNKNMKIYPNMFAKIIFEKEKQQMLTLPVTSIVFRENKYYVFKPLKDNQFEALEVKAKRLSSNTYIIKSGLKVGDEVINNALFMLDSDAVTNGLYDEDDDW